MLFGTEEECDKGNWGNSGKMERRLLWGKAIPETGWVCLEISQRVSSCKLFLSLTDLPLPLVKLKHCFKLLSSPLMDLHDSSNNPLIKPRQAFIN